VHASPSLQAAPFGRGGFEHAPVPGLHSPGRWHWSSAEHSTKLAGVQIPLWHASPSVQPLPSVHAVPFGLSTFEQRPVIGSHVPGSWH